MLRLSSCRPLVSVESDAVLDPSGGAIVGAETLVAPSTLKVAEAAGAEAKSPGPAEVAALAPAPAVAPAVGEPVAGALPPPPPPHPASSNAMIDATKRGERHAAKAVGTGSSSGD